jgi:prephenate dehydratase
MGDRPFSSAQTAPQQGVLIIETRLAGGEGVAFSFVASTQRIGFLGPFGTFTEQALLTQADLATAELVPFRSVPDVLDAVTRGEVDAGFVPIENSIEGTVNFTQDALIFDYDLLIQREIVLDIEHCLLAAAGTALPDVNVVLSIPVATAQCSAWLRETIPAADVQAANSTADAARLVGERSKAGEKGLAAVAPANAAALYGLEVIAKDIADHAGNQTRFVLVAPEGIPSSTGHDKTGIVVFQRADEPGSLISILQEFAARRINLSLLSSRPTKAGGLGDYCFIIYADGHVQDELMADVLRDLHTKQGGVKFLGSYPAAGQAAHTAREHADARWQQADDWVNDLRSQIRS